MEWHVAVFGKLTFPTRGLLAWKSLELDAARFSDWEDEFDPTNREPSTVAATLDELADFPGNGIDTVDLRFTASGDKLEVLGFLADAEYRHWCAHVAALFRVAADVGGTGDLYFVNFAGLYAHHVHVAKGASTFTALHHEADIDRLCTTMKPQPEKPPRPRFQAEFDRVVAMYEALPPPTVKPTAPAKKKAVRSAGKKSARARR